MSSINAIDSTYSKPVYNGVKIRIENPQITIPNQVKYGEYNAVNLEIVNPSNDNKKSIYDYPNSNQVVTYDKSGYKPCPVTYQTNLINNKTYVNAEVKLKNKKDLNKEPNTTSPIVPEPNVTTLEKEKIQMANNITPTAEEKNNEQEIINNIPPETSSKELESSNAIISEKAQVPPKKEIEIVPSEDILPEVNVPEFVKALSDNDYDKQAKQMELIVTKALKKEDVSAYVTKDIFTGLINIVNKDTSNLEGPSAIQIETRKKIIINQIYVNKAQSENKEVSKTDLPFQLTESEITEAARLTDMEKAERNKDFAIYTIAILTKTYVDEIEKQTGNVVPFTELPGINTIVDVLKNNENPSLKMSAMEALNYINRKEYNQQISTITELVQKDNSPYVS